MEHIGNKTTPKSLGDILVKSNLLYLEQLEGALETQRKEGKDLGEVLIEQSLITSDQLAMALSIQLNMPLIDLKRHVIQPKALQMIPVETAKEYNLIPLDIIGNSLVVVMADPTNIRVIEDLQAQSKVRIEPALGIKSDIQNAISLNYRASAEIKKQVSRFVPHDPKNDKPDTTLDAFTHTPVTQTLDLLIAQAVRDRASDIHIEPQEVTLRIRYRIDGVLYDADTLPLSTHSPLITRTKIMAGMNIAEQRRPQDGQFSVKVDKKDIDVRAATAETIYGERATLRILDKTLSVITLDHLGLSPDSLGKYKRMLQSSFGMVLVCGPTGSGKTTTLYASLGQLNRDGRNIMTIEDPVEYHFAKINQIQVNEKAGITFATGLRALMRHDPDVILVGEIRDGETAGIACQSALTGHTVFSSIHANDTISALFRLMDLGIEPYLISSSLVGIVSQRMVRRVCFHCQTPFEPSPEERSTYEREMGEDPVVFYSGAGCNFCNNTGYLGRIGVFETLVISEEIRELVVSRASAGDIRKQALREGLVTMRHDGMQKVKEKITTPAEVLRGIFSIGQ
ncbi:MAG: ATPase, T2SS/T4P/T4SS family [Chloroflexota bacterium]|nr:ATPase, T2SS/T4P/T4SS family [Chloroflexota bacterium]